MSPLVGSAGIVAAGTAAGFGRQWLALPFAALSICSLATTALVRKRTTVSALAVMIALGAGAGASAAWRSAAAADALAPSLASRQAFVGVCGSVRGARARSVEVTAEHLVFRGRNWRTRESLRISGPGVKGLLPGRRLCARGELRPPRPGRAEAPLLVADGIEHRGTGSWPRYAAAVLRRRFSEAAQRALPRTQAGLLLGMTEGDVELIDDGTMDDFRTTGLAHLVAVSGSNVAVVLAIVMLASRALIARGRWLRAAAALPPLVFFAFLTGLEPSVLRAVVTAGIALAVTAGGRTTDALRAASAAFVVLVLASPELLFSWGFQLSFAATLGLILWARPLGDRIARFLPEGRVAAVAAAAAATTLAAQAAVAPILAWHVGQIPAVGGAANLIAVPLAGVVMVGGIAALTAASLVAPLDWAPATMRLPLDMVLWCARTFAHLPFASVGASMAAGFAATAALAAMLARSVRVRAGALAVVVVLGAASGGRVLAGGESCEGSGVHALDVGQGTAVLLRAGGHAVLVDGGPRNGGVVEELNEAGVERLDAVFVSHGDADHAAGAVDVVERVVVGRVIGSEALPWGTGREVLRAARAAGVPITHAAAGDVYRFGERLRIEILWPEAGEAPVSREEALNPYSLVLRAQVDGRLVLLPGDISAEQGRELARENVSAPVLVAPHHGSKDLDPGFVGAVAPRLTLVTVGAQNRYGHPAPEALRAFGRHGRIFRTDQDGRVSVCIGSEAVQVFTER